MENLNLFLKEVTFSLQSFLFPTSIFLGPKVEIIGLQEVMHLLKKDKIDADAVKDRLKAELLEIIKNEGMSLPQLMKKHQYQTCNCPTRYKNA